MAPLPASTYLPPLDKFLDGEEIPISWKLVFSIISNDLDIKTDYKAVKSFLNNDYVLNILSKPYSAFCSPSTETKELFDIKTSAINTIPSSHLQYNISEIIEDTLWLSKEAGLDEMSALRIIILECHSRNATQLLGPFSEEEVANLHEATGDSKLSNSVSHSFLPQGLQPAIIQECFKKLESRRQRILHVYFSERSFLWSCAEHLLLLFFSNPIDEEEELRIKEIATPPLWLSERANALAVLLQSIHTDDLILNYISTVRDRLQKLGSESGFLKEEGGRRELEVDWIQTQITEATISLKIVLHMITHLVELPSSQIVLEWYQLLQSFEFFDQLGSGDAYLELLLLPLRTLSTVISVQLLENLDPLILEENPDNQYHVSSDNAMDSPFILNPQSIASLHTIIIQAADLGLVIAGPAILAWSAFLQTMSFRVDAEKVNTLVDDAESGNTDEVFEVKKIIQVFSQYENTLESIKSTIDEDIVDYLARRAVNVCNVLDTISNLSQQLGNTSNAIFPPIIGSQMRNIFLQLIRKCVSMGYIPEIVCAIISVLGGGCGYWEMVDLKPNTFVDSPIVNFLNDKTLVEAFLKISQSRFPLESLPFLQLARTLASSLLCIKPDNPQSILRSLEAMPVFTHALPINFAEYETTQEEENTNNVILTGNINLFEPRIKNNRHKESYTKSIIHLDQDFVICAGTSGRIISESSPRVACWFHQYSALKYFGKLMETFLAASDQVDGTTGVAADSESVSEIIEIFAVLIYSLSRSTDFNEDGIESANQLLEISGSGLSRNRDIISVVFDIFEQGLQNNIGRPSLDFPLQILISCVHFIHATLPLYPYRVWPLLAKSGILGVNKSGESLYSIVEGIERPKGRFDFLLSCTYLFRSLLDDLATNALRRKINGQSPANFSGPQNVGTGSPDQFITNFLLFFSKYFVDVLENSCSWKYNCDDDRRCLSEAITTSFHQILQYGYGIEFLPCTVNYFEMKTRSLEAKGYVPLMGVVMPSAAFIVESFLSASSGNLRFQPLLRSFLDGLEKERIILFSQQSKVWKKYVTSSLLFSRTLLRVSALLERPASQLEKLLFNSSPLIARIYSSDDTFSIPVINLLESLVYASTNHEPEPPSLLGHLGLHTARNFLHILSNLDKPFSRVDNLTSIWNFLGVVVSSRQQWFSNYLLTGRTPKDALKSKSSGKDVITLDQPLLATAFKSLIRLNELPAVESLSIISFVALAQNFWPWTVCNAPLYSDFIKSLLDYVSNLTPPQLRQKNLDGLIKTCHEIKIAASIAEILAMHLFHSRQTGVLLKTQDLLPNIEFYERFGVSALHYNASLHGLLKQNVEARYSGCSPSDFKRTTLSSRSFGKDYFYDLELADKMLHLDQAWTGRNGDDGLRAEFERANLNLSLVDTQIALFQSWKLLAVELSILFPTELKMQKLFCKVVTECLMVNCKPQPPEEIFLHLSQTRTEFALVLTQRLIQTKPLCNELGELLKVVWMTINELRGNFEKPIPDCDILYYRSLLKLLFLTLSVHRNSTTAKDDNFRKTIRFPENHLIPIIIDVIKFTVSHGAREIVTCIHEPTVETLPEDFALIVAILQSCLRIPSISASHLQIASILISDGTPSIAMHLFSWSDRLAKDGDPIYGELSILFLLELSRIPFMAEHLALEGLLTQISSANIMSYMHNEMLGLVNDITSRRCYSIWTRGILPLLLNLLDSVQHSIAIEVVQFLNQYPALLKHSERILEGHVMNRISSDGPKRYITSMASSEVHSMALIISILNYFREYLKGTVEMPLVEWDSSSVLENVEFWLGSRGILRERLMPTNEREVEMMRLKEDVAEMNTSPLEEKIVAQLMEIKDILDVSCN